MSNLDQILEDGKAPYSLSGQIKINNGTDLHSFPFLKKMHFGLQICEAIHYLIN